MGLIAALVSPIIPFGPAAREQLEQHLRDAFRDPGAMVSRGDRWSGIMLSLTPPIE
jgi:hypothetical protein